MNPRPMRPEDRDGDDRPERQREQQGEPAAARSITHQRWYPKIVRAIEPLVPRVRRLGQMGRRYVRRTPA
jgi:hypothetical protein